MEAISEKECDTVSENYNWFNKENEKSTYTYLSFKRIILNVFDILPFNINIEYEIYEIWWLIIIILYIF